MKRDEEAKVKVRAFQVEPEVGESTRATFEPRELQQLENGDEVVYKRENEPRAKKTPREEKKLVKTPPIKPRNYQLELAAPATGGKNSIICAPTGSGKTMTAGLVCQRLAERKTQTGNGTFKAIFVVCIRSLVAQQQVALGKYLPGLKVGKLDENQFLDGALEVYDVVVLTSQILINALNANDVDLENLTLVIFDECHHTNLDHPYNQLMRIYHRKKMTGSNQLPQILGMTASLGVGSATNLGGAKDHYVEICANLDCMSISHVRDPDNKAELERCNPRPSQNQIKLVERRSTDKKFYRLMENLMVKIEDEYLKDGTLQIQRGTQQYEGRLSGLRQEAEKTKETSEEMVACEVLMKMNCAWMIQDELRAKDAMELLDRYVKEKLESRPGEVETTLREWYADARKELEKIANEEKLEDWPLMKELYDLLKHLFEGNDSSRGKVKLLVSTDVAQEGLDIPQCNFVIRYNFVSNEIGTVQSQGRARSKDSQCFLIAYKNSVNVERELKNIGKERWMQEALDNIASGSEEELQGLIKKRQEALYRDLRTVGTPMDPSPTSEGGTSGYSFHCRRCKAFLCSADHVIKYGCHYICTDEAFVGRVTLDRDLARKEFREDVFIGRSSCSGCTQHIGSVLTYKRGSRTDGYTLGKDSVMWKATEKEKYGAIKKWDNVPFLISCEVR